MTVEAATTVFVRLVSYGSTTSLQGMVFPQNQYATRAPLDRGRADRPVILIVEDDVDTLDAIAVILEDAGYDVLRAANGREALEQLNGGVARCDLILLDLLMPVMNGWDFRRKQRETPEIAGIPVLLMSAGAHIAVVRDELKASGCMPKPVDELDLLDLVRQHCP
jgi:two-component system chemotaxis response regulator CheY